MYIELLCYVLNIFSEEDFTTFLIFILVLILTYVYFRKPVGIPPGPVLTVPILGDLAQFAFERGDVIGSLWRLRKAHGKIYSFYMGRELTIVGNGYNMIHTVAAKRGAVLRPTTNPVHNIQLIETEARLLPKISALLSYFPFLKYMPKDPL